MVHMYLDYFYYFIHISAYNVNASVCMNNVQLINESDKAIITVPILCLVWLDYCVNCKLDGWLIGSNFSHFKRFANN